MQKSIFPRKISKKFVYYNEELVTNSNFQTQLSRKLQRFRTCRKNKKCSIFHALSEYIIFSYDCNLLDWSFKPKPKQIHPNEMSEIQRAIYRVCSRKVVFDAVLFQYYRI